jgi:hypothetical protein
MIAGRQIRKFSHNGKIVLILAALCLAFPARSLAQQFPFEVWHEGKIVLLTGDTLKGMVKYDFQQDIVQFSRNERTVDAFSARKVLFYEIFDNSVHKYRQFFALPYTTAGSYRAPVFFELLEDGKMTLLAREALEFRTYSYGFYGPTYTRQVLVNKYYFLDEKGNINEFTGNKNDLLNMMGRNADAVEKYIKTNRLRFDEKYDFVKIVAYYNSLQGS